MYCKAVVRVCTDAECPGMPMETVDGVEKKAGYHVHLPSLGRLTLDLGERMATVNVPHDCCTGGAIDLEKLGALYAYAVHHGPRHPLAYMDRAYFEQLTEGL